jgi:hypothetical protein
MVKWIEILKAGKYPQGDITTEDLQTIAQNYDPQFICAPFIPEHRKFNDQGELVNNMAALGWVVNVKVEEDSLYVLPEESGDLQYIYNGQSYRYASAEIEMIEKDGKKVPYLAAVACTNFPASKIEQIRLNAKNPVKVYTHSIKIEDSKMDPKEYAKMLEILGLPATATQQEVLVKLTQLKEGASTEKTSQLDAIISLVSKKESTPAPDALVQLSTKVDTLLAAFNKMNTDSLEGEVDKAIAGKKLLPSQKAVMLTTFKDRPEDFKAFAATLPEVKVTKEITVPKDPEGKPVTYAQLLKDNKAYMEMKESNPDLLEQLKQEWVKNPK